jgi:Ca2+-binding EF-hand superfamily protein
MSRSSSPGLELDNATSGLVLIDDFDIQSLGTPLARVPTRALLFSLTPHEQKVHEDAVASNFDIKLEVDPEVAALYVGGIDENTKGALHSMFAQFDKDGNGHIDQDELKSLLHLIPEQAQVQLPSLFTDEDCQLCMEGFDIDNNGTIEENELMMWISDGLAKSIQEREDFAASSPLAQKLNYFLLASAKVISQWNSQNTMTNDVDDEYDEHGEDDETSSLENKYEYDNIQTPVRLSPEHLNLEKGTPRLVKSSSPARIKVTVPVVSRTTGHYNQTWSPEQNIATSPSPARLGRSPERSRRKKTTSRSPTRSSHKKKRKKRIRKKKPLLRPEWIPTGSSFHLPMRENVMLDGDVLGSSENAEDTDYEQEEPKRFEQILRTSEPLPPTKPNQFSPRRLVMLGQPSLARPSTSPQRAAHSHESLFVQEKRRPNSLSKSLSRKRKTCKKNDGSLVKDARESEEIIRKKAVKSTTSKKGQGKSAPNVKAVDRSNAMVESSPITLKKKLRENMKSAPTSAPTPISAGKKTARKDITTALRAVFLEADKDHTGHINLEELGAMLQVITKDVNLSSPFSPGDSKRILMAFDEDGNGTVEEEEFIHWVSSGLSRTRAERDAFAQRTPLAAKLDLFLTAVFNRACRWNSRVMQSNIELDHLVRDETEKKTDQPKLRSRKASKKKKKENEHEHEAGLKSMFQEFDVNKDGHMDLSELETLLRDIPVRGGAVISSDFTKADVARVLQAFDRDGNGLVDESEFVQWVSTGLSQSKTDRRLFAKRTPLAGKLDRLLTSVERVLAKWKRKQNLNNAELRQDSSTIKRRVQRSAMTSSSGQMKNYESSRSTGGSLQKSQSFHQPIFSSKRPTASSAANMSSHIYFDFRSADFGRTVLRSSIKRSLSLINNTDFELSVVFSLKAGSGFSIIQPANSSTSQKFVLASRSQLLVPLKFRPLLLGHSNVSIIAKCTIIKHGRAVFRCVCSLSGTGV